MNIVHFFMEIFGSSLEGLLLCLVASRIRGQRPMISGLRARRFQRTGKGHLTIMRSELAQNAMKQAGCLPVISFGSS
jgi:hypothetical protein